MFGGLVNRASAAVAMAVSLTAARALVAAPPPTASVPPTTAPAAEEAVRLGQFDEAERAYRERASAGGAPAGAAWRDLGELYEQLGEIEKAAEAYEAALALNVLDAGDTEALHRRLARCRRQRSQRVQFPISVEAETDVRQVAALLAAQRWTAAFELMASVLDRFAGTFLQRDAGQFVGVGRWAQEAVEALPDAGRAAYAEWLAARWAAVGTDAEPEALRAFAVGHPGRAALGMALPAWASRVVERGELRRGQALLQRAGDITGALRFKAGSLIWSMADESAYSADAYDGTAAFKWPDWPTTTDEWTRRLASGWEFELDGAGPAGADPAPAGVASDGRRVFVYREGRVFAMAATTGEPLWVYAPRFPAARHDVDAETFAKTTIPKLKWAGAVDPPPIRPSRAGVLIVERYTEGDSEHDVERVRSVLTCLWPQTGRVRWSTADVPSLERYRVSSDPVWTGGLVIVTVSTYGEYPVFSLLALDDRDGHVVWMDRVAAGAGAARCLGRGAVYAGLTGPTLTTDGPTLYYATQLGAVLAIDRDLRQLVWAASYPRVARFGPMTRGPLPLLERRTQQAAIAGGRVYVMPRDANALLALDTNDGRLVWAASSLEFGALIDADEQRVYVTTMDGHVRALDAATGKPVWQAPADGARFGQPVLAGETIIVGTAKGLALLRATDGAAVGYVASGAPTCLATTYGGPAGAMCVSLGPDRIRVLTGEPARPAVREADMRLALARRRGPLAVAKATTTAPDALAGAAWFDAKDAQVRFARAGDAGLAVVGDRDGLRCVALADMSVCWRRTWDDASLPWDAAGEIVAVSPDRRGVVVLSAADGAERHRWASMPGDEPIRRIGVSRRHVVAVGSSTVAALDASTGETAWAHAFGAAPIEPTWLDDALTLVVQPAGELCGRLVSFDVATGAERRSLPLAAPLPQKLTGDERDREKRYPALRLTYTADTLRESAGQWSCKAPDGREVALKAGPVFVRDRLDDGRIVYSQTDYWGLAAPAAGRVVLRALITVGKQAAPADAGASDDELTLDRWLREHGEQVRAPVPVPLRFARDGIELERGRCPDVRLFGRESRDDVCYALRDDRAGGARLGLGGLGVTDVRAADGWVAVAGLEGVVVARRGTITTATAAGPGVARVLSPQSIPIGPLARAVDIDGDLSDWAGGDEGWVQLEAPAAWFGSPESVALGSASTASASPTPVSADTPPSPDDIAARVAVRQDATTVYVAVDVTDDCHSSACPDAPLRGDAVEIVLGPLAEPKPYAWRSEPRKTLRVVVAVAAGVPVGVAEGAWAAPTFARPAGVADLFDAWACLRYGAAPEVTEAVRFAVGRDEAAGHTRYELRIDRKLFHRQMPEAGGVRILDDDGAGVEGWLDGSGALTDPDVFALSALAVPPGS